MRPFLQAALIVPLLVASAVSAQERPAIAPSALSGCAEAWSSHDLERIAAYFTDDVIYEDVTPGKVQHGKPAVTAFARGTFADVPGFALRQQSLLGGEGWATMEWVMTGTDREAGKRFSVRGVSVMGLEGGKIRRNSDSWNLADLQQQIGPPSQVQGSAPGPARPRGSGGVSAARSTPSVPGLAEALAGRAPAHPISCAPLLGMPCRARCSTRSSGRYRWSKRIFSSILDLT